MRFDGRSGSARTHARTLPEALSRCLVRRRGGCLSVFRRWALAGVLMLLAACQPVEPLPLKVGMNPWVGYDPLVLARDRQLMDGERVKVVELSSSSETLRNFRNQLLDAAALTLDEALRLADEGMDVRIVAVLSASAGADMVMAGPSVAEPRQLRGKAIAVESTTVGALMLQRLLQVAHLQPGDVRVRNMEASQHLAALRSGQVDAVVTYEPLAGAMRTEGFRPIFDSRRMPGDIVDVLVVRGELLQSRPAQVEALVAGWQRGLLALLQDPRAAAGLLAPGAGLSADDYLATLEGLSFFSAQQSLDLLSGQPLRLAQEAEGLVATLQHLGLIRERPDWSHLLADAPGRRALLPSSQGPQP